MQSVIATFDDPATAKAAVDSLIKDGFAAQSVHLQASAVASTSLDSNGRTVAGTDKGFLSGVGNFFSHLFESGDTADADKYSEAVKRGSSVVVVDAK